MSIKVFILTIGTRGDIQLFLTLGRELKCRGHQIVLGTSAFYERRVRDADLDWVQIGNGTQAELLSILKSLASVPDKRKRTIAYYNYWLKTQLSQAGEKIVSIGTESDYFISNLKLALQRGESIVPGATVTYDPPPSLENLHKYSSKKYGDRMIDLVAMNKDLLAPNDLWGKSYQFTGFWQNEQLNDDWQPPGELVTFLTEGKPLVVITMGSMVMFDVKELVQKIITALNLSGQRGLFISGWSGLASIYNQSGSFYCIREIPYDWLFPQVGCVIHHGGVGTRR